MDGHFKQVFKMKLLLITLFTVTLMGCGQTDRIIAKWTGYQKVCVEGISYIQFTSGATLQVNQSGLPVTCSNK